MAEGGGGQSGQQGLVRELLSRVAFGCRVQESGQELVMQSYSGTCWENVVGESKQGTHFTLTHPTAVQPRRCSGTTGPRVTSQQNI